MRRGALITLLGGAIVARPELAGAQPVSGMRRIALLRALKAADPLGQAMLATLRAGLHALGWDEGRNIQLDIRDSDGDAARLPALAAQLVALQPDVIVAATASAVMALKHLTQSIPIVFTRVTDPVGQGLVSSVARPGGNITGFSDYPFSIGTKWLQLLREIAPRIVQVALVYNPIEQSASPGFLRALEAALKSTGMLVTELPIRGQDDWQRLAALGRRTGVGVIGIPYDITSRRAEMVKLEVRDRLPAIYGLQGFTVEGGLISYAPSFTDVYRHAAIYVDRILRGEKPADLPVEYPTKYELSINLKTAKTLGLTVPQSLLVQANEVLR